MEKGEIKMNENCKVKKLFNPDVQDEHKLYGGCTTNTLDLVNIKYPFYIDWVAKDYANNWLPEKVDMTGDYSQYWNELTDDERKAFNNIISFLIFLDSIQTNNLPNIAENITLPEVVYALARQAYTEAIHSRSYAHVLINAVKDEKVINEITYLWRSNKILLERNKKIAEIYQEAKDDRNITTFIKGLIGNFMLEGIYFYNGFQFFHNLASRGLMVNTDTQIRYINRDELMHCQLFAHVIQNFAEENPKEWEEHKELIYDMFRDAVDLEIKFSQDVIGDKILGMSSQAIEDYAYWLGNKRLKEIKLDPIFPRTKNPYLHLEKIAAVEDESSNRTNNFEATSITYKSPEILDGWDEI